MPLNDPSADQAAVRKPRFRVTANGTELPGVLSVEVTSNNYYQADRYSAEAALNADPAYGLTWWGAQEPPLLIAIYIGFLPDGADEGSVQWGDPLITGEVDHLEADVPQGTIRFEGRDLTARLIDAKTQETFSNKTASEVASELAGRHGLTPVVTATKTLIGQYEKGEHDRITHAQFARATTEWELLTWLAQHEGFDCYVKGSELHFELASDPDANPFVVQWEPGNPVPRSNVIDLRLERSLAIARDIEVSVRSYQPGNGRGFTKTVRATGAKSAAASAARGKGNTQRYVIVQPKLTEQQALKLAQKTLDELSRHERVVDFRLPGELILTPRNTVRVQGTGASWDQTYFIDRISRRISFDGGFEQDLRCKNQSPRLTAEVS